MFRRSRSTRSRSRGQALVEFSLVAPVAFLIFFTFCQIAIFQIDKQFQAYVIHEGASAGNTEMARIARRFALDERLTQPYISAAVNGSVFASTNACNGGQTGCPLAVLHPTGTSGATCGRTTLNSPTANASWARTLAWDNECLYKAPAMTDSWSIWYPLYVAVNGAYDAGASLPFMTLNAITYQACYRMVTNTTSGDSTRGQCLTRNFDGTYTADNTGPGVATGLAPSFLEVNSSASFISLFNISLVSLQAQTFQVTDRFLPSCSAYQAVCRLVF